MNTIFLIIIGILLTVEFGIIMFCDCWRDNNPWKWFIIKTLTTITIVSWFLVGEEAFGMFDIIFVSILSICVGIDLACTIIIQRHLKTINMGLDTNFYYVTEKKVHNPKTKETIFTTTRNGECSYFRKNYCLMEWFSKHWNIDVENCTDYLVDKDDIIALIKDCQLAIDLVDDAVNGREVDFTDSLEEVNEDVQSQLAKLFPTNSWRYGKVKFDGDDYNDVKDIIRQFETTYWEDTDKLIFTNWW